MTDQMPITDVAQRLVQRYLAVQPGESFLVVTDDATDAAIGDALFQAGLAAGSQVAHARIATRKTSGEEPPPAVAAAMAAADVCACIAGRSIYHTNATGAAKAAGTRGVFNGPASLDAWTNGAMTADFLAIRETAERVADRLRGADEVRVTSPAGTDVRMSIAGREPKGWLTAICRRPGEVSALPGGEVSLPPLEGTTTGVIVVERVMTDIGGLQAPLRWTVEEGHVVRIDGGPEAERLRALISGVQDATNIAELGIGLNPAARISDDITESKKRLGTAHMAIGDNAGGYGGVVECPLHLDGMIMDVSITVDGESLVDRGTLTL
jgi:leucyl aminopeptidase (aminopeptidase T)